LNQNNNNSQISGGFILILLLMFSAVVSFFAYDEYQFKDSAVSVSGTISNIKRVPRKRIVTAIYQTDSGAKVAKLTVPFWDSRKSGEEIKLLVGNQDIKIAEFIFIYSLSVRIVAAALFLFAVVAISIKLRK